MFSKEWVEPLVIFSIIILSVVPMLSYSNRGFEKECNWRIFAWNTRQVNKWTKWRIVVWYSRVADWVWDEIIMSEWWGKVLCVTLTTYLAIIIIALGAISVLEIQKLN